MSTTHLSSSTPVSRKDRVCCWCGQRIPAGERHRQWSCIFDGEMQSNRVHVECGRALDEALDRDPFLRDDGWTMGDNERPDALPTAQANAAIDAEGKP